MKKKISNEEKKSVMKKKIHKISTTMKKKSQRYNEDKSLKKSV